MRCFAMCNFIHIHHCMFWLNFWVCFCRVPRFSFERLNTTQLCNSTMMCRQTDRYSVLFMHHSLVTTHRTAAQSSDVMYKTFQITTSTYHLSVPLGLCWVVHLLIIRFYLICSCEIHWTVWHEYLGHLYHTLALSWVGSRGKLAEGLPGCAKSWVTPGHSSQRQQYISSSQSVNQSVSQSISVSISLVTAVMTTSCGLTQQQQQHHVAFSTCDDDLSMWLCWPPGAYILSCFPPR